MASGRQPGPTSRVPACKILQMYARRLRPIAAAPHVDNVRTKPVSVLVAECPRAARGLLVAATQDPCALRVLYLCLYLANLALCSNMGALLSSLEHAESLTVFAVQQS